MVKTRLQCRRLGFDPWLGKIPWRIPWTKEPGGLQSTHKESTHKESDMPNTHTHTHTHTHMFFESSFFLLCTSEFDIVYLVISEQLL